MKDKALIVIMFFISSQYLVWFLLESITKKTHFCNFFKRRQMSIYIYIYCILLLCLSLTCFLLYKGLAVSLDIVRERTFLRHLKTSIFWRKRRIFFQISYTYVNFDGRYDFASFKFVSLFVCLLLTKIGSNRISLRDGPILLIFGLPM